MTEAGKKQSGAVFGAGSAATESIPDNAVVRGAPCNVIKRNHTGVRQETSAGTGTAGGIKTRKDELA